MELRVRVTHAFRPVVGRDKWVIDAIPPSAKLVFIRNSEGWTYERFASEIDRLAAGLLRRGIGPGDRVALHLPSGPEIAAAYYACFRIGAIAAPLNLRFKPAELEDALRRIRPSLYIGDAELSERIAAIDYDVLSADARYVVGTPRRADFHPWSALLANPCSAQIPSPPDEDAPAVLLLTSGTTGRPKLVAHSIATLKAATRNLMTVGLDRGGVFAFLRPMVHASGLFYLLSAVRLGMTIVLLDTTDPDRILDVVAAHRCTFLTVPLVSCAALIERQRDRRADVASLAAAVISADICPPGRQEAFHSVFGIELRSFFASTEGTFPFSYGLHAGLVGRPRPRTEVRLIGDDAAAVAPGEIGELWLRGPHVALGYWDGGGVTGFEDGWFRSGDMMRQEADGEFRFVGRRKDLIVRAGSNISPVEVEQVLARHPAVREAAVIGVPDPVFGQLVVGFVRLNEGVSAADLDRVLSAARMLLADYKLPETLRALDEIPRTPLGKIDRIALAAAFARGT